MVKCLIDIGTNSMGGYDKLCPLLSIDNSWLRVFVEPNPECHEYIHKRLDNDKKAIILRIVTKSPSPLGLGCK